MGDVTVAASPVMLWSADAGGRREAFNDRWLEFRGRDAAEESGSGWTEGVHPDDVARTMSRYDEAVAAGAPFSMIYRMRRADGRYRHIVDQGAPVTATGARVTGWAGAALDVSEEASLLLERDAEARLAFDVGRLGAWQWDPAVDAVRWSPELGQIFGVEGTAGGGFDRDFAAYLDRVHPEDRARVMDTIAAAVASPEGLLEIEHRIVRADGAVRWLECRGRRLTDGPKARWIGVGTDITERRRAIEERERLVAAAERARDRLDLLARVGEGVVVGTDPRARLQRIAEAAVPGFAECCVGYLVEGPSVRAVAFAHPRPEVTAAVRHRLDAHGSTGTLDDPESLAARAVRERRAVRATGPDVGSLLLPGPGAEPPAGVSVALAVPLVGGRDAIGALAFGNWGPAAPFDDHDLRLARELARRAASTVGDALRLVRERETAEELQRSLLPERLPAVAGVDAAGRYRSGTAGLRVGGDWYDLVRLDDGRVMLVVGDVVGHGVTAAVLMGQLRTVVRSSTHDDRDPAAVLGRLDRYLLTQGDGMATASAVLLDPAAERLDWATAGHPPPIVRRPGAPSELLDGPVGAPLGCGIGTPAVPTEGSMPAGSLLVLYTDGLYERRDEHPDRGLERLRRTLDDLGDDPAAPTADRLIAALVPGHPADDVAVLAVRTAGVTTTSA